MPAIISPVLVVGQVVGLPLTSKQVPAGYEPHRTGLPFTSKQSAVCAAAPFATLVTLAGEVSVYPVVTGCAGGEGCTTTGGKRRRQGSNADTGCCGELVVCAAGVVPEACTLDPVGVDPAAPAAARTEGVQPADWKTVAT